MKLPDYVKLLTIEEILGEKNTVEIKKEDVQRRPNRQPAPSEEERLQHARIAREIAQANTEELLKVNKFNEPQL